MAEIGPITVKLAEVPQMRALLKQVWGALDTAGGVVQMMEDGRQCTDLEDCKDEITAARTAVGHVLDGIGAEAS